MSNNRNVNLNTNIDDIQVRTNRGVRSPIRSHIMDVPPILASSLSTYLPEALQTPLLIRRNAIYQSSSNYPAPFLSFPNTSFLPTRTMRNTANTLYDTKIYNITKYPEYINNYNNITSTYGINKNPRHIDVNEIITFNELLDYPLTIVVDELSSNILILDEDFEDELELSIEDIEIKTEEMQRILEATEQVLNITEINQEDNDDKFQEYLTSMTSITSYLISTMFENMQWTFIPQKKILWMYLIVASKYEPRAFKYLIKNNNYDKSMLFDKDMLGYSCITHACKSHDTTMIKEFKCHDIITVELLTTLGEGEGETPITKNLLQESLSSPTVFAYLVENIPNIEAFIYKDATQDKSVLSLFILACATNKDTAKYLLDSKFMTKNYFNKCLGDYSCLMIAALFMPTLVETILRSNYCSNDLIIKEHPIYSNFIMMLAIYEDKIFGDILKSNLIDILPNELFETKLKYTNSNNTSNSNLLFELSQSTYIDLFINSKYFNSSFITHTIHGHSIFNELILKNIFGFKALINSPLCTRELFTEVNTRSTQSCLSVAAGTCESLVKLIIESDCYSFNLLKQQDIYGRNALMVLMEHDDYRTINLTIISTILDNCSPDQALLILSQKDISGLNTFAYLCTKAPTVAIKFIQDNSFYESLLETEYTDNIKSYNSPMLVAICCMSKDLCIVTTLLNSDFNSAELMKLTCKNGNNLMFEVIAYNKDNILPVLECKYLDLQLFSSISKDDTNLLIEFIRSIPNNSFDDLNMLKLNKIVDHSFMTPDMINYKSKYYTTPLLEACKKSNIIAQTILNSTMCKYNLDGINYLLEVCKSSNNSNVDLVKTFCNNPKLTKDIFQFREAFTGMSCLSYALFNSNSIILYQILNNKFCDNSMFTKDITLWINSGIPPYDSIKKSNIMSLKEILKSKYCTKDILYLKTADKCTMLMLTVDKCPKLALDILNHPLCSPELLNTVDIYNENCLHYCINSPNFKYEILFAILESKHFDINMLKNVDAHKNTILSKILSRKPTVVFNILSTFTKVEWMSDYKDILTQNSSNGTNIISSMVLENITDNILACPIITPELLLTTDTFGKSCLHDAVMYSGAKASNYTDFKKILSSDKCSTELLNLVDNDGNTFLTCCYEVFKDTLKSPYCTTTLLEYTNKHHLSILVILCLYDPESIPALLADERVTSNILTYKEGSVNNPLTAALDVDNKSLEYILESDKCTDSIINYRESLFGFTILSDSVANNNIDKINILLSSNRDLTDSFNCKDVNGYNIIIIGINSTFEIFKLLVESKYMKQEMLYLEDELGHNTVCKAFGTDFEKTKYLLDSKYWNDDLMYHKDRDDDYILAYASMNSEIVKYMLESPKCTQKLVDMTNSMGMTCAHYFSMVNYDNNTLEILLNSSWCNEYIIHKQDSYGYTCLHHACMKESNTIVDYIIKSKYYTKDLLMIIDNKGRNALMLALEHNSDAVFSILESDVCTPEVIFQKDRINGDNVFNYAIKYSDKAAKYILNNISIDLDLTIRNYEHLTPIMLACKYNGDLVEVMLQKDNCSPECLTSLHSDFPSALTLAARYQSVAIKHILKWDKINWIILNSTDSDIRDKDNKLDFIGVSCKYNPESLKYALESSIDLSNFFHLSQQLHPIMLATKYQPDALKLILESKYINPEMFLITYEDVTCIELAFDSQPKSLWNIINSDIVTEELFHMPDQEGYSIIYKLTNIYPNIKVLGDINISNMIKYTNIVGEENSDSLCMICCEFKNSIVFNCGHLCCVGCAFKLLDCHTCRKKIKKKTFIYE